MISGVILVKDQVDVLERCIKSLLWCQEIIVIDDNSSDGSGELAKKLGAKVYKRSLNNNFSEQRNFALKKVTQDWALFIDADEVVTKNLSEEIYQQTSQFLTPFNGFFIKRVDFLWGRRMRFGEVSDSVFMRLARVEKGDWKGQVHEVWDVQGGKSTLKNVIEHYPHPSITEFLSEINYYSTLRAQDLYKSCSTIPFWQIIFYPPGKFFYNYVLRLGFLDGVQGIILALMMSMHSFLVRGKLWQLNLTKKSAFS